MTAAAATLRPSEGLAASAGRVFRRNTWTIGLVGLLIAFLVLTRILAPNYGLANLQSLEPSSRGGLFADMVINIASFDPVLGDVDK